MRIPRIYHPEPLVNQQEVALSTNASRHIVQVLRLKPGAALHLFDGLGGEYEAILRSDGKKDRQSAQIIRWHDREAEPARLVDLGQGIAKGERMDYILQKAVELGIASVTPLQTERTVVKLEGERLTQRLNHWQGIMVGACEQSGRNRIPELQPAQSLMAWLPTTLGSQCLLLSPTAKLSLGAWLQQTSQQNSTINTTLLIGPEGGLADWEEEKAIEAGFFPVHLGSRILRTETAILAALAVLQLTADR